jgi:hypothetical protein
MQETYRYYILAYEDARQKRPMKHQHGGPPSSPMAPRRSGGCCRTATAMPWPTRGSTCSRSSPPRRRPGRSSSPCGSEPPTLYELTTRRGFASRLRLARRQRSTRRRPSDSVLVFGLQSSAATQMCVISPLYLLEVAYGDLAQLLLSSSQERSRARRGPGLEERRRDLVARLSHNTGYRKETM